jgi:tetratricopeptide (TPR) repeat protein
VTIRGPLIALASVLVFSAAPSIAVAEDAPAPRRRRAPDPRPTATLLIDVKPEDAATLAALPARLGRAIKNEKSFRFKSFQAILEKVKRSLRGLGQADELLEEAKQDIVAGKVREGIEKTRRSIELFEKHFAGLVRIKDRAKPLAEALRTLAIALHVDGKHQEARDAIRRLLVLAPKTEADPQVFPRKLVKLVDVERKVFDDLGGAEVQVETDPPGARVYLNARRKGVGPATIKNVRAGFNYLTARAIGYRTTTIRIEVAPPKQLRTKIVLERLPDDPVPLMKESLAALGAARMTDAMRKLATRLEVDVLVLGRAEVFQDLCKLSLFAYDARTGLLRRGPVTASPHLDLPEDRLEALARTVLGESPVETRPPPPRKVKRKRTSAPGVPLGERLRRFRRSRAFWPVVGSVAGAVVAGAVVGLAVGLQSPPGGDGLIRGGGRHVILGKALLRF